MLTGREVTAAPSHSGSPGESASTTRQTESQENRLSRVLRVEWLGQMIASLCWIVSVFSYGISETGDWLQLAAACSWMLANIAAIVSVENS